MLPGSGAGTGRWNCTSLSGPSASPLSLSLHFSHLVEGVWKGHLIGKASLALIPNGMVVGWRSYG